MRIKTLITATAVAIGLTAAAASPSFATKINGSINQSGSLNVVGSWTAPTSINFVGNAWNVTLGSPGTGDLSGFSYPDTGNIKDLAFPSAPVSDFFDITVGASTLSFDLASVTSVDGTCGASGCSLVVFATGTLHLTGYEATDGIWSLTTQCVKTNGNCVISNDSKFSFSSTTAAVPEPASIALLGAGLFGLALGRRRRRKA